MIINIPLQIDEATFEQKVRDDYAESVKQLLLAKVDKVLKERDKRYYKMERDPKVGLESIIYESLDIYMNECKDEIIEKAADKLAERLARTKKAKAILEGDDILQKAAANTVLNMINAVEVDNDKDNS